MCMSLFAFDFLNLYAKNIKNKKIEFQKCIAIPGAEYETLISSKNTLSSQIESSSPDIFFMGLYVYGQLFVIHLAECPPTMAQYDMN